MTKFLKMFGIPNLYNKDNFDKTVSVCLNDKNAYFNDGFNYRYYCLEVGELQLYTTVDFDIETKKAFVTDVNTHSTTNAHWNLKIFRNGKDYSQEMLVLCGNAKKDHGICVIDLITPDVLPRITCGDKISVQVIGLAHELKVFSTGEEYEAKYRDTITLNDGDLYPLPFMLHNKNKDNGLASPIDEIDGSNILRATVLNNIILKDYPGIETNINMGILFVKTCFGFLRIYYDLSLVDKKIKKGDTIFTTLTISADAILLSELLPKKNLDSWLYFWVDTITYHNYKRSMAFFINGSLYSEKQGKEYVGIDAYNYLMEISKNRKRKEEDEGIHTFRCDIAKVVSDGPKKGKKCIAMYINNKLDQLCFITIKKNQKYRLEIIFAKDYEIKLLPTIGKDWTIKNEYNDEEELREINYQETIQDYSNESIHFLNDIFTKNADNEKLCKDCANIVINSISEEDAIAKVKEFLDKM